MLPVRLKQIRLSKGLSLEALSLKMKGLVTKQALSKYEQGLSMPSPNVLAKMAEALEVRAVSLFAGNNLDINFIGYRKRLTLSKKEQIKIENIVKQSLEERIALQEKVQGEVKVKIPVHRFKIDHLDETEDVAEKLRENWDLGKGCLANVVSILEEQGIHIVEIDVDEKFDGLSAAAYEKKQIKGAIIAINKPNCGERQRLNLTHELGHLVLNISETLDQEKAAFRFGAAFLVPKNIIYKEIGIKRRSVSLEELLLLKRKMGISIQALVKRLKDLNLISANHYSELFETITKLGWRKKEPETFPSEQLSWVKQNVLRGYNEGLLSKDDAENILKEKIEDGLSLNLNRKNIYTKISSLDRKRLLREQSKKYAAFYKRELKQMQEWQEGDILG